MSRRDIDPVVPSRSRSHLVSLIVVVRDVAVQPRVADEVARQLCDGYDFFELILLSTPASSGESVEAFAAAPFKVRSVVFDGHPSYDEMAAYGYSESIGDMVVVVPSEELGLVDLPSILTPLLAGRDLVRIRRRRAGLAGVVGSRILKAVTGFHVDTRFYRVVGIGRQMLSRLGAFPDQLSFLRFSDTGSTIDQVILSIDAPPARSALRSLPGRIDLAARLVSLSAPRLLRQCSALCSLVAAASMSVVLYVVAVWLLKTEIAEGWTSTTLLMASWMSMQSLAMAVVCLGAGRLLDRQGARRAWRISGDTSVGDLFAGAKFINVEDAGLQAIEGAS